MNVRSRSAAGLNRRALPVSTVDLLFSKHIHSANVWHRDLKPGNLLVNVRDVSVLLPEQDSANHTSVMLTPLCIACLPLWLHGLSHVIAI